MFIYLNRLLSKSLDTGDAFHIVLHVLVAKQLLYPLSQLLTDWEGHRGHHSQTKKSPQLLGMNMSHDSLWYNKATCLLGQLATKKLDLTVSKWKFLLLDESTEVSGWIHASHLGKCPGKRKMDFLKHAYSNKWWNTLIWNSCQATTALGLLRHSSPKSHRSNRAFSDASQAIVLLFFTFLYFFDSRLLSSVNGKGQILKYRK